ncbi:hypothetical protein [[Eubacterium] cellulosolvens]
MLNVLILIFIPLVRGVAQWTALGAGIVGAIALIVRVVEMVISPLPKVEPLIGSVLVVFFAFFAFRAYCEKPSS